MNKILLGLLATAMALVAACGGSGTSSTGGAGSSTSSAAAAGVVATGSTSLGTVLTNTQGFTLYYFTPEQGSKVVCTGSCATTWPPVTASGGVSAPSGVTGTFATVTLADGSMEVTYNGWPLHTYAGDSAAGQTNGQGIEGKWFAATPGLTANAGGGAGASSASSSSASTSSSYGY